MKLLLIFAALVPSLAAQSADTDPLAQLKHIVVTQEKGKVLRAHYKDGLRVAEARLGELGPFKAPIVFEVTENQCRSGVIPQCALHVAFQRIPGGWFWLKHPDPARVDQMVREKDLDPNTKYDREFQNSLAFFSALHKKFFPDITPNLPLDEMKCDRFDWLPRSNGLAAPKTLSIASWSGEQMTDNRESDESENMILTGAYGVELEANQQSGLDITSVDQYYGDGNSFLPLFGEVVSWNLKKNNGESCSIAFKPNVGAVLISIREYFTRKAKVWRPFVWESSKVNDFLGLETFYRQLDRDPTAPPSPQPTPSPSPSLAPSSMSSLQMLMSGGAQ